MQNSNVLHSDDDPDNSKTQANITPLGKVLIALATLTVLSGAGALIHFAMSGYVQSIAELSTTGKWLYTGKLTFIITTAALLTFIYDRCQHRRRLQAAQHQPGDTPQHP